VNTWKIAGNDCVESPDNGQLSAVFLSKITKCKKFSFNKYLFSGTLYHVFTLKIQLKDADNAFKGINAKNYQPL
jgi:hypothetical protein